MNEKFSDQQIEDLRKQFAAIETVNPTSATYQNFAHYVGELEVPCLSQIAGSGIKWLSRLAKARLPKEPSLVPACGGTETPVTANGRKYLYCWDKNRTGTFPGDHVYVDLATDIPLSQEEHNQIFGNSN
jgi:hypothetical protein